MELKDIRIDDILIAADEWEDYCRDMEEFNKIVSSAWKEWCMKDE